MDMQRLVGHARRLQPIHFSPSRKRRFQSLVMAERRGMQPRTVLPRPCEHGRRTLRAATQNPSRFVLGLYFGNSVRSVCSVCCRWGANDGEVKRQWAGGRANPSALHCPADQCLPLKSTLSIFTGDCCLISCLDPERPARFQELKEQSSDVHRLDRLQLRMVPAVGMIQGPKRGPATGMENLGRRHVNPETWMPLGVVGGQAWGLPASPRPRTTSTGAKATHLAQLPERLVRHVAPC